MAAAVLLFAAPSFAQRIDPVAVSPDKYKVLLDNDQVRVVLYTISPGESDQVHEHPARVSYVLSGGSLRISLGDRSFETEEHTGNASYMGAVPAHSTTNIGKTPVSIILFELKKIDAQAVPAAEDPFANNPKTLTVQLENDSVRVMEAVIPPAWKETQHTHPPYVTYILNGGTVRMHFADGTTRDVQFNTGEAKFTDKVTHWAENIGADTVKVVLVELRHR
jgi:quercetin dioxygenase-like cupin family protein